MNRLAAMLILLCGCLPAASSKPAVEPKANVCDGMPHRVGDVILLVRNVVASGTEFAMDIEFENMSEGRVIYPAERLEIIDNYGNYLHASGFNDWSKVKPGDTLTLNIAAKPPVDNARVYKVKLHIAGKQHPKRDGYVLISELEGEMLNVEQLREEASP